jgi:hypothetical protein
MLEYYIYAYLRKKDNTPYYIGKGKNKRAWSKDHRVSVPKDKTKIIIMEKNLTEFGALALERRYIRWYGRKDNNTGILHNRTDGGDVTSGLIITDEVRQKISLKLKGKKKPEGHGKKVSSFRKKFRYSEESKKKIGDSNRGKKRTAEQIEKTRLSRIGKKQPESQKIKVAEKLSKEYELTNPNGNVFKITNLTKFCRENGMNQANMYKNQIRGWKCRKLY